MAETNTNPKTGDLAPDFALRTNGDGEISLSACKGKPVVLYFYPNGFLAEKKSSA